MKVKLNVQFCAGISGCLAAATVIVCTTVCSDAAGNASILVQGGSESSAQPKETLMLGTIFDNRLSECHL